MKLNFITRTYLDILLMLARNPGKVFEIYVFIDGKSSGRKSQKAEVCLLK